MTLILSGTDGLSDIDGSAATPAIRGTDTNTGIFFPAADTIAFSEGGVESMRLDSSGNVNVTAGRIRLGGGSDEGTQLNLWTTVGGDGTLAAFNILFNTGSNNSRTERARITSGGDLLVNTTTSRAKETIKSASDSYASGGIALERASVANYWNILTASTNDLYFGYNTTDKGYIRQSDGAYISLSDERTKKNIADISYGLSAVLALRPCSFHMKEQEDIEKKSLGFIAQAALQVVPESVSEMQGGMYGMDKAAVIPVLVKAIQEQQAIIQSLTARIEALEGK